MNIHWSVRCSAFALSVWTLSLFFAGWREINTVGGVVAVLTLASGVVLTGLLLFIQGYWIYFDEKNKGGLRREIKSYDGLHSFLDKHAGQNRFIQSIQPVVTERKGTEQ